MQNHKLSQNATLNNKRKDIFLIYEPSTYINIELIYVITCKSHINVKEYVHLV